MTKKQRYEKIERAVRRHGEVTIHFQDQDDQYPYRRRRKISSDGKCFVSYLGHESKRWSRYQTSCFVCYGERTKRLSVSLELMRQHDGTYIKMLYMVLPSGKKVDL